MKKLLLGLASIGMLLSFILIPNLSNAQSSSQTPTLESIDLPFNIDGFIERQSSLYGDWTKGSQTNGTDSGSVLFDNGNTRDMPLTYHISDLYNTPGSGTDDVFNGGNKSNANPTTWGWKYGSVPNKDEMNNANIHISNDKATGDLWAIMAGDRYTITGTSYIDFEFYQNGITAVAPSGGSSGSFTTSGTDCGRTIGDLLVTVEYTNGGSVDSIYFYRWAASVSATCGYDWEAFTISSADAFGYSNTASINAPYSAFGLSAYTSIQFVEAAINVTNMVDGSINTDPCTGLLFETVFVKTKSSSSSNADLKDMIAPIQLVLNVGVADISYPTICKDGGVYSPTNSGPASTDGGSFTISPAASGVAINGTTGDITVGPTASGSYSIVYTYSPRTGCTQYDTAVIDIEHRISGNVFHDVDGVCVDNEVDGSGINNPDGSQLYAVLVNGSGEVVESVAVAGDGSYEFSCGPNGTFDVLIKTSAPTVGSTGNTSDLPGTWAFTGEKLGTGTGTDGSTDGELSGISVSGAHVTDANFGINERPDAISYTQQINKPYFGEEITIGIEFGVGNDPGQNSFFDLRGEDNEDGTPFTLDEVWITGLPLNDSNEVWYNGTQITLGDDNTNPPSQSNPYTITSFDNSLLTFKIYCCQEAQIMYSVVDGSCLEDQSSALYRYTWLGAVPVEFIGVKAKPINGTDILVEWSTASELNNESFEVERMFKGEDDFVKVGEIFGAGNSNELIDYSFVDRNVQSGATVYYRIKQIDYDGQFDYSDVVRVDLESVIDVSVYPNPTKGNFTIKAADAEEVLHVELLDLQGSVIGSWDGIGQCDAETTGLSAGLYTVRVVGSFSSRTIMIQID